MNLSFLLVQPIGNICKSVSFVPRSLLVLVLLTGLGSLTKVEADGMFVAPKFVWDKHKDINEPTQKAILVYAAGREDLILQVNYEGPVDEFGWLIPVPNLPAVEKGSMECFYELSQFTQRHFEWPYPSGKTQRATLGVNDGERNSEPPVKVIEIKTVGAYEVAVLSTRDSGALAKWLDANQFYFPTNKTEVLDDYVKWHWYFVAVKINLGKSEGFQFITESPRGRESAKVGYSTELKELAAGELHPLQISFASDRCVYPLKISSVNGRPSEVQVYVLSPEPLLETTMFEKKLPIIYSNDVKHAAYTVQWRTQERERRRTISDQLWGSGSWKWARGEEALQKFSETPAVGWGELLPFAKIVSADLPVCSATIPTLLGRSWWLTKQTWTLLPEQMQDLEFQSAGPVFTELLDTEYGYFAAASLAALGKEGLPRIITAMASSNRIVRVQTAEIFVNAQNLYSSHMIEMADNPGLKTAALTWLRDSEPSVRLAGFDELTGFQQGWKGEYGDDLIPLLDGPDLGVRQAAIDLLGSKYEGPLFDKVVPVLLRNTEPNARMTGLMMLYWKADQQSVAMALPLLKDPIDLVQERANAVLCALTGQHFSQDQPEQWEKWWADHQANFVVERHPEELQPPRVREYELRRRNTNALPTR